MKYTNNLKSVVQLDPEMVAKLEPVVDKFVFRSNDYYSGLINWDDPNDPIKRLIIPTTDELDTWGDLDASMEHIYQPVKGLEHKYPDTALLLCNDVCAAYCRFCFRKRLFQDDNDEVVKDVTEGVKYIENTPSITNVLLTGGDPLVMSTNRLEKIILSLIEIPHVKIIRIGTKMLAFNPFRVLEDESLLAMLEKFTAMKQIFIMAHFNHVRELTEPVVEAIRKLSKTGVTIVNQTPLIRGVNNSSEALSELFSKLSFNGVVTYYVFACRPTLGNKTFALPVEEAYQIFEKARQKGSGLAKTAKFIMSHRNGKIEIVGMNDKLILMKNHNIVNTSLNGKVLFYKRNPEAYWYDDYTELVEC